MKKVIQKTFIDLTKEEAWLNEQGQQGLMLVRYSGGSYEFEDAFPAKYCYQISIPDEGNQDAYFSFLEEMGITVVAKYAGRVYLRKNAKDGPFELYTDLENRIRQLQKKNGIFTSIAVSQFGLGVYMLLNMIPYVAEKTAPFWILLGFGSLLIVVGIAFFTYGIGGMKKIKALKAERKIRE